MKKSIMSVAVGVVSCTTFSFAVAADLTEQRPYVEVAAVQSWAGFYFGGQLGGIVDHDTRIVSSNGGDINTPTGLGGRGGRTGIASVNVESGLFAGAHAGYNWQRSNTVFGIEGDIDSLGPIDNLMGSIRGRLGVSSGRALFYGTAGVAFLNHGNDEIGTFIGGNGGNGGAGSVAGDGGSGGNGFGSRTIQQANGTSVGFVGGGGVEYRLSRNVGLGVEGLYYSFDEKNTALGSNEDFFTVKSRITFHTDSGASDSFKDATSYPGASNWAGFYVGGHIGALYNTSDNSIGQVALANGENGKNGSTNGVASGGGGGGGGAVAYAGRENEALVSGGGHIGYNLQSGGLVYGVEADGSVTDDDHHQYLISARGRLGVTQGSYMFYGTAGIAFTENNGPAAVFASNGGNGTAGIGKRPGIGGAGGRAVAVNYNEDQVGFVVGAGIEAKITSRINIGLEGLFYKFDNDDKAIIAPAGSGRTFASGGDNDAVVLRSRLSFQMTNTQDPLK